MSLFYDSLSDEQPFNWLDLPNEIKEAVRDSWLCWSDMSNYRPVNCFDMEPSAICNGVLKFQKKRVYNHGNNREMEKWVHVHLFDHFGTSMCDIYMLRPTKALRERQFTYGAIGGYGDAQRAASMNLIDRPYRPMPKQAAIRKAVAKEKYQYYVVNYSGFRALLASGFLNAVEDALTDFDITQGFEEDRWIKDPKTLDGKAKSKIEAAKEAYGKQQIQEQNRAAWKGRYKPARLTKTEMEVNTPLSRSGMMKSAKAGALVGLSRYAYRESLKHELIARVNELLPKISGEMINGGGVLVEAGYWYFDKGDQPKAQLRFIHVVGVDQDYKPLIKRAMTGPFLVNTPPTMAELEFLFIWVVKEQ